MGKPSVMHISTPLSWRGGEQQILYLMQGLEFSEQWLFCPLGSPLSERATGLKQVHVIPFQKRGGTDLRAAFLLLKSIRKFKPDILHAHDAQAHTLCVLAHLLGAGTPIVLHRRVDFEIRTNFFTLFKYRHSGIKRIICVSEAIRQIVLKAIPQNGKVVTIHSCAVPIEVQKNEARKRLDALCGFKKDDLLIGNISALADHKDLLTFLRTAAHLHKSNPKFRFVLIGDGEERGRLEAERAGLGLEDVVSMPGYVSDARNLMPALDLFLFTSKTEGLGTTVLDAMLSGVPVVATCAGGVPEMIVNQKTGVLCEIGDDRMLAKSVLQVLEDDELRKNLVDYARQTAAGFSIQSMTEKTLNVYEEVLKESI